MSFYEFIVKSAYVRENKTPYINKLLCFSALCLNKFILESFIFALNIYIERDMHWQ